MISPEQLSTLIQGELPDAQVQVEDLTGGGDHLEAIVVSSEFTGKTMVKQHQLVYAALDNELRSQAIHALALETYTPEDWQATGQTI